MKAGGSIVIVSNKNNEYICAVNGKASKIRNGTNSPLEYPIFEYYAQCAGQLGQDYWRDLFTNASKGIFPNKSYKMTNGRILSIKVAQNNTQTIDIIPPDSSKSQMYYEACKDFFTNTSGVASKSEDIFIAIQPDKIESEPWSGSIQPYRQIAMINIFVEEKATQHNLSESVKDELRENLIAKIFSGEISSEIKKIGHTIHDIEGLTFENGRFFIQSRDPKVKAVSRKKAPTTTTEEQIETHVFRCSRGVSTSLKNKSTNSF